MQVRYQFAFFKHALVAFGVAMMLAACGGGDGDDDDNGGGGGGKELAAELLGTWDLVELEVLTMTMDCPGEMGLSADPDDTVECSAGFVTFNADGTYFSIETFDSLGNPSNLRTEGTWSTNGNILTTTDTHEGPDGGILDPIDPVEPSDVEWSISGNTLSITITDPFISSPFILRWQKR